MSTMRWVRSLLFALAIVGTASTSFAGVFFSITVGTPPPGLVYYAQPPCPGYGYIWVPGYWAYGPYGFFWVPGTWVTAPEPGLLWTPGYWAWDGDGDDYVWNAGYWAPQVGFYGGIDYGYGYNGYGYQGGYWNQGRFYYNTAVNNVSGSNVRYVYTQSVSNTTVVNRVSYNGGRGGTSARPTREQLDVARRPYSRATPAQERLQQDASSRPELRESVNHGMPRIAATSRPDVFSGRGVVAARPSSEWHGPAARERNQGRAPEVNRPARSFEPSREGNGRGWQRTSPAPPPPSRMQSQRDVYRTPPPERPRTVERPPMYAPPARSMGRRESQPPPRQARPTYRPGNNKVQSKSQDRPR